MSRKLRAVVIEDSLTVRKRIVEVLSADPDLEVVGEADDSHEAIALCERLCPDVVTLDMVLRTTSGLDVTEHVMAFCPTPILIVSASVNRGEAFKTFDALAAGAVDVLEKPSGDDLMDDAWEARLVTSVKRVSRIKVITHPRARLAGPRPRVSVTKPSNDEGPATVRVVAIGASTGGPAALAQIFRSLPATFPVPILLVVHIGQQFAVSFAEWLDQQSALRVRIARDGIALPEVGQPGVIMAPADRHLILRGNKLHLTSDAERHSCRPSVDVLFESVARELAQRSVACLLTGMGRDGAAGLLTVRRAGGATMAQDEATSVVFGMPREAIALGAVEHVLPLDRIAPTLRTLI